MSAWDAEGWRVGQASLEGASEDEMSCHSFRWVDRHTLLCCDQGVNQRTVYGHVAGMMAHECARAVLVGRERSVSTRQEYVAAPVNLGCV